MNGDHVNVVVVVAVTDVDDGKEWSKHRPQAQDAAIRLGNKNIYIVKQVPTV